MVEKLHEEVAATAPEIEVCTPVSLSVMTHSKSIFDYSGHPRFFYTIYLEGSQHIRPTFIFGGFRLLQVCNHTHTHTQPNYTLSYSSYKPIQESPYWSSPVLQTTYALLA
jgi:hypothetical protein